MDETDTDDQCTRLVGLAFPSMVSMRVLGAAVSPLLFAHLPVALIIASPFLIHLVAVAPLVEPVVYFPIALAVTTVQALIGFYFGNRLGRRALAWLVHRVPVPEAFVERCLELVRTLSVVAVFAFPGPVLGTIAGVAGVRPRTFNILVLPAQAVWVVAAYMIGEALFEYIAIARGFVIDYAFELTALTVCIVALQQTYKWYRKWRRQQSKER